MIVRKEYEHYSNRSTCEAEDNQDRYQDSRHTINKEKHEGILHRE